jgi:F0F1-type ATP synthase assembly protein I
MTDTGPQLGTGPALKPKKVHPPVEAHERDGWQMVSYMFAGPITYGGIGWLIGHYTGVSALFPIGFIVGVAFSVLLIILRVTRS